VKGQGAVVEKPDSLFHAGRNGVNSSFLMWLSGGEVLCRSSWEKENKVQR